MSQPTFIADPSLYVLYVTLKPTIVIMGPVGSAKTSHVGAFLLDKAQKIRPCTDGVRRSRTLVTRSTYPELKSAWLATWKMWFGGISTIKDGDLLTIDINAQLPDGTRMEWQAVLLALEHKDDLGKLRGVEFTNAVINEGTTCASWVYHEVASRMSRYPARWQLGLSEDETIANGPDYWSGVVIDSNKPEEGLSKCDPTANWVYTMVECTAPKFPDAFEIIDQPGALTRTYNEETQRYEYKPNPAATYARLHNKGYNYWLDMLPGLEGKDDKIKILILNEFGMNVEGTPVFREYSRSRHEDEKVTPQHGRTIVIGCDSSGTFPAMVVMQRSLRLGKLVALDEVYDPEKGLEALIEEDLKPLLEKEYPGCPVVVVLDPSNPQRSGDHLTAQNLFVKAGFTAVLAPTNLWEPRRNVVQYYLRTGLLLLGPRAQILRQGMRGRYIYKHDRTGNAQARPHKVRPIADIQDSLQYACLHYFYGDARSANDNLTKPEQRRRPAA